MTRVSRKINKQHYIIVGIITALIFLLGISFGLIIDYERVQFVEKENQLQKVNYDSLQLQYLYLSYIPSNNETCPIIRVALEDSIAQLAESLDAVERYKKDSNINEAEYAGIEREYLIDNLRYWMFSRRLKDACNEDVVNILYFFSLDRCDICPNQGTILTYFKKKLEDKLLVFPINMDLEKDEQFIKILKLQYNITTLPSLVINGQKYEGVVSKDELAVIICAHTLNKEKCLI
jgi:hypothetical protein